MLFYNSVLETIEFMSYGQGMLSRECLPCIMGIRDIAQNRGILATEESERNTIVKMQYILTIQI